MKNILICWCLLFSVCCAAQNKIFTEEEFVAVVKKYHPLALQAAIDIKIAQAGVTISRSPFDPVVTADNGRKDFEGLNYYNQRYRELKIPTWYGIDLYAGQEDITGSRINPEETKGNLNYIGFSVPLLQNFVVDKRRAFIRQATIARNLSEVERDIAVNDLAREALKAYWEWWEGYHAYNLVQSAIANAVKRFDMVKTTYRLGDRPAIDTLEALTQIQTLQLRENEAYLNFIKSGLQLSVYLWKDDNVPYELPPDVVPQPWTAADTIRFDAIASLAAAHPELTQYNFKLESLRIEQRLKFQYLLPDVKLKYNQIGKDVSRTLHAPWFENNYRYGLAVSMPLRLSEGRGGLRQARLKIDRT
ncbi:MAG TPA: TolC family protein, partial [Flavisolibacter sp.]|nr:TolC family protein [Flavisolibacter sp.]